MAMLDVMISDLPHVEYRKEKILQSDVDDAVKQTESLQNKVKQEGTGVKLGNAINAKSYVRRMKAKGKR